MQNDFPLQIHYVIEFSHGNINIFTHVGTHLVNAKLIYYSDFFRGSTMLIL